MGSMTILWQVASWGLTIATARYLLPNDYGVLSLAETFAPYISLLATLSVGSWLIQATTLDETDVHAASLFSFVLASLTTVFAYFLSPHLARFYGDETLIVPFRMICVVFFLRGLVAVPNAVLQREIRFKELSILSLTVVVLRGVVQLLLAMHGFGFWTLIFGMLLAETVTCGVTLYLGRKALRWKKRASTWRRIVEYGVPASLSAFCWILFNSADNVIVGKMFGAETLGIYAMAYYLSNLPMTKINGMFRSVAFSYLSRLKEDREAFRKRSLELNRIFCLLIFPVLCGMALVAERAIPLCFGQKWLALSFPLEVLSFSAIFRVVVDSLPSLLAASGNPVQSLQIQLLGAAVLPLSFFIGAKMLGMQGIFGTWLFVFPVTMIFMIRLSRRALGIGVTEYLYNLRGPAICTLLMSGAVALVQQFFTSRLPTVPALAVDMMTGVAAYALFLFTLFRDDGKTFLSFFVFRQRTEAQGS